MISRRQLLLGALAAPAVRALEPIANLFPLDVGDVQTYGQDGAVLTVEMIQEMVRKVREMEPPIKPFVTRDGRDYYLLIGPGQYGAQLVPRNF